MCFLDKKTEEKGEKVEGKNEGKVDLMTTMESKKISSRKTVLKLMTWLKSHLNTMPIPKEKTSVSASVSASFFTSATNTSVIS